MATKKKKWIMDLEDQNSGGSSNWIFGMDDQNTGASPNWILNQNEQEDDKKFWQEIFQKPEVFDDGYDFGDITKTILGTAGDIGLGAVEGVLNVGDSVAKLISGGIAQVSDWVGADEFAQKIRTNLATKENPLISLDNKGSDALNDYSVLGESGEKVANLVGYTGGLAVGGYALGGAANIPITVGGSTLNIPTLAAISGAGSSLAESYQNENVTDTQAWLRAFGSGTIEGVTEGLFGMFGVGGSGLDDMLSKEVANQFKNGAAKVLTNIGIKATGESVEEFLSYAGNQGLDWLIDKASKNGAKFYEDWNWEEVGEEMALAFISAGLSQGGSSVVNNTVQSNNAIKVAEEQLGRQLTTAEKNSIRNQVATALVNENTLNEQKVIDYIVNQESQNQNYTNKEIRELTNKITNDLREGNINTKYIENALGDVTTAWTNTQNQINELEQQLKNTNDNQSRKNIQNQIKKLQESLVHDSRLQRNYYERSQRSVNYAYESNDSDSEIARATKESAAKVMNNTTRTRNFVESVANIAEDTSTQYIFTNNEQLKAQGYEIKGKNIDGLVNDNGTVLINIDSPKALNKIIGHETTHLLENTPEYQELQDMAIAFAKVKGEYDNRLQTISEIYKGVKANILNEFTSDLVGDYIFDTKFLQELANQKPTLFQKIYNYIRHLANKVVAKSVEARELEDLKYKFQKVYLDAIKNKSTNSKANTQSKENVKYHISKNASEDIDNVLTNINERNPVKLRDFTPQILVNNGIEDLPMYENPSHIRKNILSTQEAIALGLSLRPADHYHGLGKDLYLKVIDSLDSPRVIFKNKNGKDYLILTALKDNQGNSIIVPIEIETTTFVNNVNIDTNRIKSVYGYNNVRNSLSEYIKHNINNNTFEKIYEQKKKSSTSNISQSTSNTNNIPQISKNVKSASNSNNSNKTSFSLSENQQIQGLENYTVSEIKDLARNYIEETLLENNFDDINIKDIAIIGSRGRGNANTNSDLDIVVEYDGDISEDSLFNILNEDPMYIDDIQVDINPITASDTGTLSEYLERSNAYDQKVLSNNRYSLSEEQQEIQGLESALTKLDVTIAQSNDVANVELDEFNRKAKDWYEGELESWEEVLQENPDSRTLYNNFINEFDNGNDLTPDNIRDYVKSNGGVGIEPFDGFNELVNNINEFSNDTNPSQISDALINSVDTLLKEFPSESISVDKSDQSNSVYVTVNYNDESYTFRISDHHLPNRSVGGGVYTQRIYDGTHFIGDTNLTEDLQNFIDTVKSNTEYSLSTTDNQGRTLSKEQQEFFKDSKVRDENGNLLVMYHGTNNENFYTFDFNKIRGVGMYGKGFYFSDSETFSHNYGGRVIKAYLNLKNPLITTNSPATLDYNKTKKLLDTITSMKDTNGENYSIKKFGLWATNEQIAKNLAHSEADDWNILSRIARTLYNDDPVGTIKLANKVLGTSYDGIISRTETVAFYPNQIKNIDNLNPTSNEDIRYSLNVDDYGMWHRPSTDYGDASNFEENMPGVFEHPEWYVFGNDSEYVQAYKESLDALKKVRNNPEGEIIIYRATTGDTINEGDWVTPSKTYAKWHNYSQLDGKGNVLELKVKAKDIRFAGDDINEFGYFPNEINDYSLSNFNQQQLPSKNDIAPVNDINNIYGRDVAIQPEDILPTTEENVLELFNNQSQIREIPPNPTKETSYYPYAERINRDPFMEYVARKADNSMVAQNRDYTPKVNKSKLRNATDTFSRLFVNRNVEIDNLAKESGNRNIKITGDMLNNVYGEVDGNLTIAQTDSKGNVVGDSLRSLFQNSKDNGYYEVLDDYLKHYSNIDRHGQGKGSKVPLEYSEGMVAEYEKLYPYLKEDAEKIWKYGRNIIEDMKNEGLISDGLFNSLKEMYPHYVPYMQDTELTPYMSDTGEIKPKRVVKYAKGKAKYNQLMGIEEALTKYTYAYKKAIRQNELYKEIVSTLGHEVMIGADTRVDPTQLDESLYIDENGAFLTAYFDGVQRSVQISDDLYRSLKNDLENNVRDLEQRFELITKPIQKISQVRRNLLTTWSPSFLITNPLKDIQDAMFSSKYTKDMLKFYPSSFTELFRADTDLAKQFLSLYGSGNTMGEFNTDNLMNGQKNIKFLSNVAKLNSIIELAPRFAEFKASLKNGTSVQEAMYNAREVTTNFGRGGIIAKALNRNGATFLNASIQGFSKFVRNIKGENGVQGVVGALAKATVFGIIPAVFNHLAFGDDDEDYEALPDYIKDNYYLIKTSDGTFIRIPKGRMISVFGSAARRTLEYAQGEEDAFEGYLNNALDQIGPNNPLDENILSPLIQAFNNEAWYGGDLVPSRLQNLPAKEQYDEGTDKLSIFLGQLTGLSPYKINYVLDQYSGGIGDLLLPTITEEATSDGSLLAPIKDKFVVNSTTDNKYVSDIYDLNDELYKKSNSRYATDEDILMNKYIYSITSEMGQLYGEIREIQSNTNLSKEEKYNKAQAIKEQINSISKEGLDNYKNINKTSNYAIIGDKEYYVSTNESGEKTWSSVESDELEAMNSLGMDVDEKSDYYIAREDISNIRDEAKDNKEESEVTKQKIANRIIDTNLNDNQKYYLYDRYYGTTETLDILSNIGIPADEFIMYDSQNFTADKNALGETISNSKKIKVFNYINSMNIDFEQKLILAKLQYNSYDEYNVEIINYLNSNPNISYDDEVYILEKMGFEVDEEGNIRW